MKLRIPGGRGHILAFAEVLEDISALCDPLRLGAPEPEEAFARVKARPGLGRGAPDSCAVSANSGASWTLSAARSPGPSVGG